MGQQNFKWTVRRRKGRSDLNVLLALGGEKVHKLTAPSLIVCSIEAGKKSQDRKMITFAFGATSITVNKKCTSTMDFCIYGVKSSVLVRLGVSHWRGSHMKSSNFPTISH